MSRQLLVTSLLLGFLFHEVAQGTVIEVPADHSSIQAAIDAAVDGDEILVAPGTYNEVINFLGKAITVRSTDGPDVTIIDGTGLKDSVVKCISAEGSDTMLEGFTITGGEGDPTVNETGTVGGGMRNAGSSPTVRNCRFIANAVSGTGDYFGGGMYNIESSPAIINCVFDTNFAESGGAMFNISSSPTIIGCVLTGNSAFSGGGIMITHESAGVVIANCLFYGNVSMEDGRSAIGVNETSQAVIANCTIVNNEAGGDGSAIRVTDFAHADISNCIVWNNGTSIVLNVSGTVFVNYSLIEGGYEGTGNLDVDPLFVDSENDDYHIDGASPCIDAGDNEGLPTDAYDLDADDDIEEPLPLDLDGYARAVDIPAVDDTGNGTAPLVDMGAYEVQGCEGDANGDGMVDPLDAGFVLARFGCTYPDDGENCLKADTNGDGQVDPLDVGFVLARFGDCE